jgi:hypothetical protein
LEVAPSSVFSCWRMSAARAVVEMYFVAGWVEGVAFDMPNL